VFFSEHSIWYYNTTDRPTSVVYKLLASSQIPDTQPTTRHSWLIPSHHAFSNFFLQITPTAQNGNWLGYLLQVQHVKKNYQTATHQNAFLKLNIHQNSFSVVVLPQTPPPGSLTCSHRYAIYTFASKGKGNGIPFFDFLLTFNVPVQWFMVDVGHHFAPLDMGNKKFELMLTRRAKPHSSSCSVVWLKIGLFTLS